jgi:hypothetical protein
VDNSQKQPDSGEQAPGNGDAPESSLGPVESEVFRFAVDGTANEAAPAGMDNQLADNDILAAMASVTPETLANIEHALDQLTSATNLFDVPALDFDGAADS